MSDDRAATAALSFSLIYGMPRAHIDIYNSQFFTGPVPPSPHSIPVPWSPLRLYSGGDVRDGEAATAATDSASTSRCALHRVAVATIIVLPSSQGCAPPPPCLCTASKHVYCISPLWLCIASCARTPGSSALGRSHWRRRYLPSGYQLLCAVLLGNSGNEGGNLDAATGTCWSATPALTDLGLVRLGITTQSLGLLVL